MTRTPLPYGAVAPAAPVTESLPPGHQRCPCGAPVKPWFRGRGVGHGIWFGVVSPVITLAIYALILALAVSPSMRSGSSVASVALLAVVPAIFVVTIVVLASKAKHRGLCLLGRSLVWFAVMPGAAFTAVAAALP